MRSLLLFVALLGILVVSASAQDPASPQEKPIIESVHISGVAESRVGPEIRERMQELVGQRFDQLAADEVAFEIQNRLSERVTAIREFPGSEPDRIRLVFEIGDPDSDPDRHSDVNSRYTVEDVELRGVPESSISDQLLGDMRGLVGQRLDQSTADAVERRLARELRPTRLVARRVTRGADRNHVRLIFEVTRAPLFEFRRLRNYLVGHSKQSVSFGAEAPIGGDRHRVTIGAVNDGDELLERFAGYRLGFESIRAGTEHLGFRVDFFSYHEKWKASTEAAVAASPNIPGIYRERRGVEPTITLAWDRRFRVHLGVSVTELQIQYPEIHFENANAGIATAIFEDRWEASGANRHHVLASYGVRAASNNLESDFVYTRHAGEVRYRFSTPHNEFVASAAAGRINGSAPLFERFTLGNTSTLRGWNKYDLAPAGGNRMAYGSLEYRFTVLQVFYDVGAVWDAGQSRDTAHAVGFGIHSRGDDSAFFITFGVPIRSGRIQPLKPVFMIGGRF